MERDRYVCRAEWHVHVSVTPPRSATDGGGGGIRTPEGLRPYRFSRPAPSTARPPLRRQRDATATACRPAYHWRRGARCFAPPHRESSGASRFYTRVTARRRRARGRKPR